MRKIIFIFFTVILFFSVSAKTPDEKVAQMLNAGKWFDLREYYQTKTDSVDVFLDDYAKAMLAYFFNQPEKAANLCQHLLNSYQLDPRNVLSTSWLFCNSLNRLGQNEMTAKFIDAIESSFTPYYNQLDSATVLGFKNLITSSRVKARYKLDQIEPFEGNIVIPFSLKPIQTEKRKSEVMEVEGMINGHPCSMVFDTGAGTNIISDSLALTLNLDIIDLDLELSGVGNQSAKFAVAKELTLGDLKITNVPFYVTTLKTGLEEADRHMGHF